MVKGESQRSHRWVEDTSVRLYQFLSLLSHKDRLIIQIQMLQKFGEKTKQTLESLLLVLTSSLPISDLMREYCLSGDTYHSGEYGSLPLNVEHE